MGGTIRAIEQGYFQRAIAESANNYAKRKESGDQVVVGVNKYVDPPQPANIEIHRIDPEAEAQQITRLRNTRARRNNVEIERLLDRLAAEAESPRRISCQSRWNSSWPWRRWEKSCSGSAPSTEVTSRRRCSDGSVKFRSDDESDNAD